MEGVPSPKPATLMAPPAPARRSPVRVAANDAAPAPKQGAKSPAAAPATRDVATSELSARFVGHGALNVRSSVTGRHYRFQGHGDCQKIDKHDMMLLKRIPDLIVS